MEQQQPFFFDETLLRDLANNFFNNTTFDDQSTTCSSSTMSSGTSSTNSSLSESSSSTSSLLQFFNNNQTMMSSSITCECEGGFELNSNSKVSRPRGAPFSIYVNDKLHVNISTQWLNQQQQQSSSSAEVKVVLKTFLFEDVSLLDSIEENTINLEQAKLINNNQFLQVTLPIRRDNTTRRKTRKTTAKTIKGEDTAEDLERKRRMRRSVNQEATKKVSYIQIIANQQVLATSQNMWCRSKTRGEMNKKKERKVSTPSSNSTKKTKRSTKRKQEELIPLDIDQQMISNHLIPATKRVKQTTQQHVVEQQATVSASSNNEEEIPAEWLQAIPTNWQETFGVTCVDGVKQLQTTIINNEFLPDSQQEFSAEEFNSMFQEQFPSPACGAFNMPSMGINLDDIDWSNLFEQVAAQQGSSIQQQGTNNTFLSKPICLDDFDFFTLE